MRQRISTTGSLAIIGVIIGEFITAQAGLGYLIIFATARADTEVSMAAIVALARVSGKDVYSTVPGKTPAPDKALQAKMFAALDRIDPERLAAMRAAVAYLTTSFSCTSRHCATVPPRSSPPSAAFSFSIITRSCIALLKAAFNSLTTDSGMPLGPEMPSWPALASR